MAKSDCPLVYSIQDRIPAITRLWWFETVDIRVTHRGWAGLQCLALSNAPRLCLYLYLFLVYLIQDRIPARTRVWWHKQNVWDCRFETEWSHIKAEQDCSASLCPMLRAFISTLEIDSDNERRSLAGPSATRIVVCWTWIYTWTYRRRHHQRTRSSTHTGWYIWVGAYQFHSHTTQAPRPATFACYAGTHHSWVEITSLGPDFQKILRLS